MWPNFCSDSDAPLVRSRLRWMWISVRELSPQTQAYIDRLLADASPLTDEQRTRLAELLRPVRQRAAQIYGDPQGAA
jgi:hypothetical protein